MLYRVLQIGSYYTLSFMEKISLLYRFFYKDELLYADLSLISVSMQHILNNVKILLTRSKHVSVLF